MAQKKGVNLTECRKANPELLETAGEGQHICHFTAGTTLCNQPLASKKGQVQRAPQQREEAPSPTIPTNIQFL